ncbi:MAG: NAD(P)-dependent glycerol-3-phosphate dehydrogenase [Vampirovibrionales bacterium]|nr:NAD(P)-dependent glycerol-3-phosphate dehydrogenase [Vampirovibrionales bacterium]
MSTIAYLGAGSWGLTLAWLGVQCPERRVRLWDRDPVKIARFCENRTIQFPIEVTLPPEVSLTSSLEEAAAGADVIVFAVTSAGTREVAQALARTGVVSEQTILVNASKGIEYPSLTRLSAVMQEIFPKNPLAALSGPTLAPEILKGLPTAGVIASDSSAVAERLQALLATDRFRLYTNTDVVGVELGGALKNIFAIVSGYMDARHLGDNARATLITRGLAEITRFSLALGADVQTLYGLSGLGDLLATCYSPLSRNYQVGYRLAQGQTLEHILAQMKVVAEGVQTTQAVSLLSDNLGIEMPVVKQVEQALSGALSEREMIHTLMSRRPKAEHTRC